MIVIFAKTDDEHALAVKQILETQHQEQVYIFDTSSFPTSAALTGSFQNGSHTLSLVNGSGAAIDLCNVKSFWWRRPQGVSVDPQITDIQARNFAYSECLSALNGILGACGGLWMNDVNRDDAADYKPRQLKVAVECGFSIPETLITNDPQLALEFWNQHPGQVVYKAFNQRAIAWRPTRMLQQEDLPLLHNVSTAPVIFQTFVPGQRDIRATVVGDKVFAAEFVLPSDAAVDHRELFQTAPCFPHSLPLEVVHKVQMLMKTFGLEYGAVDFRVTPEKEYVFFEINTGGEFLYIQHRTRQPIAQAVAAHLARGESVNSAG